MNIITHALHHRTLHLTILTFPAKLFFLMEKNTDIIFPSVNGLTCSCLKLRVFVYWKIFRNVWVGAGVYGNNKLINK